MVSGREMHDRPRAVTQDALIAQPFPSSRLQGADLHTVASSARWSGLTSAFATGLLSGAAVFAAHTYSARFRAMFGVSGKTALVVSPMFGAFFLKSHLVIAAVRFVALSLILPT